MSASPISATPSSSSVATGVTPSSRPELAAVNTGVVPAAETETTAVKPNQADLEKAVATLNKFVEPSAHAVNFSIDSSTGKTVIKVVDTENNKVLQQFPSEDALSMIRALDKLQGFLVKEKA